MDIKELYEEFKNNGGTLSMEDFAAIYPSLDPSEDTPIDDVKKKEYPTLQNTEGIVPKLVLEELHGHPVNQIPETEPTPINQTLDFLALATTGVSPSMALESETGVSSSTENYKTTTPFSENLPIEPSGYDPKEARFLAGIGGMATEDQANKFINTSLANYMARRVNHENKVLKSIDDYYTNNEKLPIIAEPQSSENLPFKTNKNGEALLPVMIGDVEGSINQLKLDKFNILGLDKSGNYVLSPKNTPDIQLLYKEGKLVIPKDDGNDLIYGRDFKVTPNGNLYTSDWFSEDEQKPFQNETKQLNEIPYIDKGYQFHYDGGKTLTGTKGDTTVKDFNDRYLNHPDYKVVTDEQGQPIKEEDGSFIFEVVSDKEVERINNEIRKTNQSIQKENELNGYSSKDVFGNEDRYYLEQKQLRAIEEGAKISQQEYERQVKEFGKDVVDAYGGLLTYDEQEVEKAKQMQLRFMQLGYGEAQSLALAEKYMATQKQDKIRKSQNVVNYISAIAQQSATGEYSSSLARYKEDTQFTPSEQQVWQDIAQNPLFGDFMDEIGYKLFGNIDKGLEINAATTTLRKRIVDTFYAYQMERFNNYSRALVDLRGNQAKKNVRNAIKEDNGEAIYKAQKAYEPIRNHLSNASYLAEDLANKQKAYDKGFDLENERNLDAIKEYEDYDRSYIGAKLITKNILNGAFNVLSDVALGVMYPFSSNEKIGTYLSAADYTTKDFFRVMNQGASESYEIFKDNKGNQYKRVNDKVFVLDKNGNIHYNEELTYNPTLLNQFKKVDEGKDFNAAGIARLLTNQIGMMYGAETIAGKLATKTVGAVGTMKYARNVAKAIDIVGKDSQLVKNMNLYSSVKGVYSSAAWGEMVAKNNFVEAKNAGLDNKQAFIYSLFQNVGTMALIHVSPDAKFFKEYETASKDLIKLISKNKWQEAGLRASNALKVIGSGIRSENLQEITEQVYNDAVNVVTNTITKSEQLDAFSFDTYDQTVRDTTLVTLFLGGTNAMLRKGKSNVQINIDGLNKLQQYIVASVTPDIDTYLDKIQGGFLGYTEKQVTETKAAIAKVRKYVEQIPKDMPIDIQLGEEIVLSMERIDNYKQQLSKTDNEVIIDEIKKKLDKENEFLRTLFQNRYDNTKEYHNNSNTDAETNHNDDIKNNNTNDETTEDSHFEPSKETVVEKDEAITINNTPNTSVNNDVPYSTTTTENTEDNDKLNSDINEDEVLDSILNNPTFSVDNDNAIEQELENASDNSPAITNDKLDTKLNSNPTDTQIEIKPLSEISTDENRFQARKKLNETVINNIANNYSEKDQDPIHVWQDPKDGKTYVLSGHHRYYGAKQAGRNDVKIIDRTKDFTEEEAIRFAKEEANANRSMETPLERAATLRQKRERNDAQEDINNFLNREGKNKRLVHNLSYLNPKGKAVQSVASFENSSNSDSKRETEKIADWIGEARRIFGDKLTDAHENEMFDFLNDKEASKRFSKKGDFVEKVRHIVGGMYYDSNAPLNLKRIENKGNTEMEYENEMRELKNKAAEYDAQISNIDDRFTNAKREDYISPDAKDFKEVKEIARKEKERLKNEQKAIYSKIDKLQREKGKYIKADIAQPTLFQKGNVNTKTISKKAFDELIERLKKPFAKAFKNLNVTTDWETFKNRLNALGNVGNLEDLAFFQNLSRVNEKFNKELDQLIKGTLPKGHIFQLGKPSPILKSSGIPDLPIELNADRLKRKSEQENHLFDLENVKNLSTAIQYPIAVFDSTKKDGSKVILTDIKDKKGSNYVVAMRLSHKGRGRHQIEINDIKSVYPKEHYLGIIDWINSNDNLLKFADKEKVLNYISVQSTNLIGNGNIAKDGTNVHQKVEKAKQSIQDFQNPISDKEISDIQFNKIKLMQTPNGEIYGAKLPDGTIYINPNKLNANTPIHEFSHLWEQLMPNAWKRGVELLKQTKIGKDIFGKLKSEGNYQNLTDEQLWSEALNTHIGNYGEWQYHSTALQKLGQWLKNLFQKLGDFIKYKGKLSPDTKLNDFTKGVLGDLLGNNELIGEEGFNHHKGETQYSKQDLRHAAKEMIGKVVSLAFNRKKGTESITVGYFNDYAKSLIEEVSGLKLKHRVSFEINESDVRHSIKEHFGKNETDSRNHPIQKEDYDKILDIASNPDRIVYIGVDGKTGLKLFSFQKEYENGDFAIVKFIGKSGGRLSFKTFYQNKKGIHQRQNADLKQSPSANAQTRSVAFPSYDANVQNLLNFETDTNKEYVDNHINNDNNDIRFHIIGDNQNEDSNNISSIMTDAELYDNLMPVTTLQSIASAVQENDLAKAKSILENSSWYKGLSQKDKKLVDGQSVKNVVVQQAKKRQEYKKLQTPEGIKEVFENKINQYKNAKLDTRSKIALKREAQRQAAYAIKQYVVKNRMKKKLMPGQANRLIKLATEISYPRQNLKSVYGKIEKFIATYEAIKEKNISATKQEPKTTYEESKTTYEKVNTKLEKGVNLEDFKNIDERKTAERILERERAKTAPEGEGFKIQEEAFEASENKIKEKKPIKEIAVKISRQAAQSISDRQFVPKLLLEASGMDNAYDRFINVQGANGRAQKWMDKLNKKVYDGIYGKEYQMLNKIIDARATISIDQYREKEGLPPIDHHNGFNQYYAQDALNGIKEALGNKRFDELNNRASAYFAFHHEIVDKLHDNGIISEDTAKILKAREYSPRFFLEHMEDFEGNIDQQHSEIFNNSSGKLSKGAVQSLGEGSKGLKVNDTQYLMTNYVNKMSQLIAQNELNKTFAVRELPKAKQHYEVLKNKNKLSADERRFVKYFKELESKVVLNPITGITPSGNLKYEHDAAPKGFSKNYYYDDGVRQEFFLANELHDQWNDLNKGLFKSGDIKEVTSILTGVAMNKATATGYNPVFFLTNTPRDFLMVSTISNEYSSFKPIAWVQTLKDATIGIMEKRKFSKGENSLLEKYIEYGGMMDFLNKQGVIRNDGIIDNITSYLFGTDQMKKKRKFSLRKTLSRLNVLNDYSEVMFRVGLMNRTLNNQLKAYNKEHNTNYKSVEELDQQTKDDMYHRAVREARSVLDFNQGGTITKDLDGVLSYANVMVQGPRVVADAFRKNPVKTTVNMLQTSTILPALKYGFSMGLIGLFRDDDDELSNTEIYLETLNGVNETVRRSNFIIPLGIKDEEGNWKFLAIAKPQELQPLFTLTDRLIENHLRKSVGRKSLDWNLILRDVNRSFDSALPVNPIHNPFGNDSQLIDLSSKSPGIKASIIAGYGINPFTKQPVSSDVGKVSLSQEGMNDSRIEGFYKTLFPIIGISPARAKAFIESFITQPTTNTYVHIGYSILDLVTGNGDLEKFKNNLYKTATRRVLRETSEFNYKMNLDNEYETELENIKESADKNNAELKSLVKYAIDNNLESYEAYDYFESKIEQMNLSETEKKAYYKKAKDNFKQRNTNYTTDKYDSMLYSIRNESDPEVKAKMIKVYFGDDIPEEVRERGKQLGNIFTKRVNKILEEDD